MLTKITSRISTDPLTISHSAALYQVIADSRADLQNLVWARNATLESTIKFTMTPRKGSMSRLVIMVNMDSNDAPSQRGEAQVAGIIETWAPDEDGFVTFGYWLGTKYRGYGIMSIVLKHVANSITREMPIKAKVKTENIKSFKIMQTAGLKPYAAHSGWIFLMRPTDEFLVNVIF